MDHSWDIFLSFAHDDLADARWLARSLEDRGGWRCFVANDHLDDEVGSAQWSEAIDRVLDQTSVLVLVISPAALKSRWVLYEWRGFHDDILGGRAALIVPVCVRGSRPEKLPRALRRYQCVELEAGEDREAALVRVVHLVRSLLDTPGAGATSAPPVVKPRRPRRDLRLRSAALAGAFLFVLVALAAAIAWKPRQEPRLGLEAVALYSRCDDADVPRVASATAWEEAAADFENSMNQWKAPARWRAGYRFSRGERAYLLGDIATAIAEFQESIRLDPTWALPHVGLSNAIVHADPEGALQAARTASGLDDTLWIAVAATALAEFQGGHADRAIEDYRRALALAPDSGHLKATLALALRGAGRIYDSEAAKLARDALASNPNIADAHVVLAETCLERGELAAALFHAEHAAGVAPRSVPAELVLGDALQATGDLTRARDAWKIALDLGAEVPDQGAPGARLQEVKNALALGNTPPCRCPMPDPAPASSDATSDAGALHAPPEGGSPPVSQPVSGPHSMPKSVPHPPIDLGI